MQLQCNHFNGTGEVPSSVSNFASLVLLYFLLLPLHLFVSKSGKEVKMLINREILYSSFRQDKNVLTEHDNSG